MKANELRIGNWVQCDRVSQYPQQVAQIDRYDYPNRVYVIHFDWEGEDEQTGDDVENINPIPLTELWLEKFGFKSIGLHGQIFEYKEPIGNGGRFVIETDCQYFYPKINFDDCYFGNEFKYVHQLQNLYFALTGEELCIKE